MTIYLPEGVDLFRPAFDTACDRILRSESDVTFYTLYVELIACLRKHPLFKSYISELEEESEKQKQEFATEALEALEDSWRRLWKHHRDGLKYRKRLIRIKRAVTTRPEISLYAHPYHQIVFNMREFLHSSPLIENPPPDLFSPKIQEVDQKFFSRGQKGANKQREMQARADIDPAFCWARFLFLQKCYAANGALPRLAPIKGRWPSIRKNAWKSMIEIFETWALVRANVLFLQATSHGGSDSTCHSLAYEYQIHRKDYEKYLNSLKNHVHNQLFKIENQKQKAKDDPRFILPGTQKRHFVIDLASQYWMAHPSANRDEVFNDYRLKCPFERSLSRRRWEQIVRECKLDPRPREAQKRGLGKKSSQN